VSMLIHLMHFQKAGVLVAVVLDHVIIHLHGDSEWKKDITTWRKGVTKFP
jgi:hypothetical protein